jgi:hypothetical protein
MSNTNVMKQLRGARNTKIGPRATRALPRLENMALELKSGENGHLARANGAIDGPYCSPTCLAQCVWKAVCAAGWSGWWVWGVELHQRPQAPSGALLQFECLSTTRGVRAFGSCSRRPCVG